MSAWVGLAACSATPDPAGPAAALDPAGVAPAAAASEATLAAVVVRVSPHERGARAVFELPEAARSVPLLQSDAVARDAWRVVTPGVRLVDGVVTSADPITRFEVVIAPDPVEVDRVYPSLHRVGKGVAIYGPSLLVAGVDTRVVLRPAAGGIAIPEREAGAKLTDTADAVIEAPALAR